MMKIVTILCIVLSALSTFSQEIPERVKDRENKESQVPHGHEVFHPDLRLLNTSVWQSVTPYRFECSVLRLAVEWRNNAYWLMEMDGQKRLLAHHKHYAVISHVIVYLTLRRSPNWMEYHKLQVKESHVYHFLKLVLQNYAHYHFGLHRFSF